MTSLVHWVARPRLILPALVALVLVATLTGTARSHLAGSPSTGTTGTTADLTAAIPFVRPNIVLITTDDQSLDDLSVMPEVERRLGRRGTTFTHAYSPNPLCCPARATILTGLYTHNHHVYSNHAPNGGVAVFDDSNTLPLWLQGAGYRTIMMGKYLNEYGHDGDASVPPGWDEWHVPVDDVYDYRNWTVSNDGVRQRKHGYQTSYITHKAVTTIEKYAAADDPFFLWSGYLAPHFGGPAEPDDPDLGLRLNGTPNVAAKYREALTGRWLPRHASINETDVADKPQYVQEQAVVPRADLREIDQQRKESLMSVDDGVGRILEALRRSGELDNTVVIFTSDNGYLVGEHRWIGKLVGYDESIRVPMIVRGPGFAPGVEVDQSVSLVDIAPTVAGLAGATPGLVEDGVSLSDVARGVAPDDRAILLMAAPPLPDRSPDPVWYTGIRTDHYTYLVYETGEIELYDLDQDPYELDNLAGKPAVADVQADLQRDLDALHGCSGAECLIPYVE